MTAHRNTLPPVAQPIRKIFDPWNSSATGHQRAENNGLAGSTSWRASRTLKLGHQFKAGPEGGERLSDSVGMGSKDFGQDGRLENGDWQDGAPGLRESGWQDVRALLSGEKESNPYHGENIGGMSGARKDSTTITTKTTTTTTRIKNAEEKEAVQEPKLAGGKIFQDLRIYINGTTAPLVSDHRLKQLVAEHGGSVRIALGRRSVTHVILGTPNNAAGGGQGAGGGLAAGKIQKEIKRVGGCGVKYVGVEWVLESIKAGKRLPEARFSNLSTAAKGQRSVYGLFRQPLPHPPGERRRTRTMRKKEGTSDSNDPA